MNRFTGAFALVAVAAVAVASAQTSSSQSMTPQQPAPSSQYPSESSPPASTSQSDGQSTKDVKKQQMKDCMAQQQANNTGKSKKEMKEYCKNQVNSSSPQD